MTPTFDYNVLLRPRGIDVTVCYLQKFYCKKKKEKNANRYPDHIASHRAVLCHLFRVKYGVWVVMLIVRLQALSLFNN